MGSQSAIPISSVFERTKALQKLGDYQFRYLDIAAMPEKLAECIRSYRPEAIVNLAQQPSAAFSMSNLENASWTVQNNVLGALNLLWCMREYVPDSHLVTLGTMGEYGCPNLPIPEGFFKVTYRGMTDILPFPRQTNSVYHTSKVQTSDLAWFAARVWELRITDVMQGIVYGTRTDTMTEDVYRTRFDIDECFGTMINRATACAVIEHPILVYGSGLQTRAYIQLRDSIKCLTMMTENHPTDSDSIHGYRVVNQFDESYSCREVAEIVRDVAGALGYDVEIEHVPNPRIEPEVHFYEPEHEKLYNMGWKPTVTIREGVREMIEDLSVYRERIEKLKDVLRPKIVWRPKHTAVKGGDETGRKG